MQPLKNVKVIEFCSVAAGPFAGMLLADFGADVIKVERPDGGDSLRSWPPLSDGFSENFASLNRNKRSVTLNMKRPEDLELARQLVLEADVVLENNRPGVMDRLGLGYSWFEERRPELVYCSISAYGQKGPRSKEGGFDLTLQAISGIMGVTGEMGGAPVKCGVPLTDFCTGLYAAMAVIAALQNVATGGKGTHIDVPMLGASLAIAALQTSEYFGSGKDPRKLGSAHPRNAPYQAFKAQDGYFAMAAGNDALWQAVCRSLERPELADDPRFASTSLRAQNQEVLRELLESQFATMTSDELLSLFREAGVPCAPINTYSEALADEQVKEMGWIQDIMLPGGATTKTFGSPLRFSGQIPGIYRNPPSLGEHNSEILDGLRAQLAEKDA